MSLIADALKTAQREKQLRDSGGARPSSPLLVPLRASPPKEFSWRRSLTMGVSVVVFVVSLWVVFKRVRAVMVSAPTPVPASVSSVATIDSARVPEPEVTQSVALMPPRASNPAQRLPASRARTLSPPASAVVVPRANDAAVLQAQRPTENAAAPGASAAPSDVGANGRLRIAIEEPREGDVARLFALAVAAHRAGDLTSARILYERVLTIAPSDVDALNNMGILLSSLRDFDRAEQLLRRAIALAPRNASAWNNLGNVLRERGRSSDAIAAFQYALNIDPGHQGARISLAQQYLAIGSLPQARQMLEEVIAVNPAVAEAQYALGQVLELQGDRAGALRAYTTFIRVAPPSLRGHVEHVQRRVEALGGKAP